MLRVVSEEFRVCQCDEISVFEEGYRNWMTYSFTRLGFVDERVAERWCFAAEPESDRTE